MEIRHWYWLNGFKKLRVLWFYKRLLNKKSFYSQERNGLFNLMNYLNSPSYCNFNTILVSTISWLLGSPKLIMFNEIQMILLLIHSYLSASNLFNFFCYFSIHSNSKKESLMYFKLFITNKREQINKNILSTYESQAPTSSIALSHIFYIKVNIVSYISSLFTLSWPSYYLTFFKISRSIL